MGATPEAASAGFAGAPEGAGARPELSAVPWETS